MGEEGPAPKRGRRWLIGGGIVAGGGCAALLICVVGIAGLIAWAQRGREPLLPVHHAGGLTPEDVIPWWPDVVLEEGCTGGTLRRFDDGGWTLKVNYVPTRADASPLELRSILSYARTPAGAVDLYAIGRAGLEASLLVMGGRVERTPLDHLYSPGDESQYELLVVDGRPYGNLLLVRQDHRLVQLLMAGLYFDDAQASAEFFDPVLERLWAYELPP